MTFAPDAQHLVPNAGDPQTEPGDCTNLGDRRRRWSWRALRRLREGYCHGCKSWQPVTGSWLQGWDLDDHPPAPPQHDRCPHCGRLYPSGPSYTDPPCDTCAARLDQGDGTVWDEGMGVDTGWEWGLNE